MDFFGDEGLCIQGPLYLTNGEIKSLTLHMEGLVI